MSPSTMHSKQLRASGEDYILHPLGTATICADLRLDSHTIAAALLHDVVEDTERRHRASSARSSATRWPSWSTASPS